MRSPPAEACRRAQLGVTVLIITLFSLAILGLTRADQAAFRAAAAGPAGEAPPPGTGNLRRLKRGAK